MVSKASDDFPEPETPVTTVKVLWGTSKSTFFRLWTRAPRTTMLSVDISKESKQSPESGRMRSVAPPGTAESFYYKAGLGRTLAGFRTNERKDSGRGASNKVRIEPIPRPAIRNVT